MHTHVSQYQTGLIIKVKVDGWLPLEIYFVTNPKAVNYSACIVPLNMGTMAQKPLVHSKVQLILVYVCSILLKCMLQGRVFNLWVDCQQAALTIEVLLSSGGPFICCGTFLSAHVIKCGHFCQDYLVKFYLCALVFKQLKCLAPLSRRSFWLSQSMRQRSADVKIACTQNSA